MQAGVPQVSRKCRMVKLMISPRSKANKVVINASRSTSEIPRSVADRNDRASIVIFHPFFGPVGPRAPLPQFATQAVALQGLRGQIGKGAPRESRSRSSALATPLPPTAAHRRHEHLG